MPLHTYHMFYASGSLGDNHLQRIPLNPHSDRNSGCHRLRFTFNRSSLIQTTGPLCCNGSSYARSLLHRFRCFVLCIASMLFTAKCGVSLCAQVHLFHQVVKPRGCPSSLITRLQPSHRVIHSAHRIDC